jgi:hypothetical protein
MFLHTDAEYDDVAWEQTELKNDEDLARLGKAASARAALHCLDKYQGKGGEIHTTAYKGSFNSVYKARFLEPKEFMCIRIALPCPYDPEHNVDKMRYETATIKLVRQNTTIPIPAIHRHGPVAEGFESFGSFMIMDFLQNTDQVAMHLKILRAQTEHLTTAF